MNNERLLRDLLGEEAADRLLREEPDHPILTGDAAWIEDVLAARKDLPLPELPALVSQDLRDLFDERLLQRRYEAVLVSDSRETRQLAGVRGAGPTDLGWSLSYSCEAADILLDIWPDDEGIDVDGQVMAHGGETAAVRASITGLDGATTTSDELGRFRLTGLAPESYELTLANRRVHIVLRPDLRRDSS